MGVGNPKRKPSKLTDEKPDIRPAKDNVPLVGGNKGDSGGNDPPKKAGDNGDGDSEDGSQRSPKTTPEGRPLTNHALGSHLRHRMTLVQIDGVIDNYSRRTTQADGATVYIQKQAGRGLKYSVVIVGDDGVVTAMRDLSHLGLANLAKNHGFNPDP